MRGARLWLAAGLAWAAGGGPVFNAAHDLVAGPTWERRAEAAPMFNPSTKVVLFTPGKSDPLVARIEAELAAVGIAVQRIAMPPDSQIDAVVTREIAAGASAAIRIIPHSRETEVWTGDTTARVSSRRSARSDTSDAALSVIALRTVEFLRATLLDVRRRRPGNGATGAGPVTVTGGGSTSAGNSVTGVESQPSTSDQNQMQGTSPSEAREAPTPPESPPQPGAGDASSPAGLPEQQPPKPVAVPRPEDSPPSIPPAVEAAMGPSIEKSVDGERHSFPAADPFEIAAGPAILASPGGVAPMGALAAIGRVPVLGRASLELMALFPVMPARINSAAGSVDLGTTFFGAGTSIRLTPAFGRWVVDVGVGGSVAMLRFVGNGMGSVGTTTTVPNMGFTGSTWKASGHVRMGTGYRLNRWLVLRADALGGLMAGRFIIGYQVTNTAHVVDTDKSHDLATWGPLFAGGTLSLQAAW